MRTLIVLPGRHICHEPNCRYLKYSKRANWWYVKPKNLKRRGYRPCKYCCTVRFHLIGERKILNRLIAGTDMAYRVQGEAMYVKTGVSCWRILYSPETLRYQLYHRNHSDAPVDFRHPELEQYHFQGDKRDASSMAECFRYIQSHDAFRAAEQRSGKAPKEENISPKYRRQLKHRKRRQAQRKLDSLFSELEQEHPEYEKLSRW